MDEIRVEKSELDETLKRLHREGMAVSSIVPEKRDDAHSPYILRVYRRTEIRDDK